MNVTRTIRLTAATLLTLALFTATNASARTVRCVVPKLSGVTLKVARHRLEHAHCRAGMIHRPKTASGGLIVRGQRPKAGRKIRRGSKVTLWLRAKPSKVTLTAPAPTPTVTTPTSTPAPAPIVRAAVDPSFTQDPTDNLKVTWSYSASAGTATTLPDGVLSFSVTPATGSLGPVGGCTINVGAITTGGTCTIELSSYGQYDTTVTYTGSGTIAPSTQTETDTVEPLPVTNTYTWGTDAPTQGAYVQTILKGNQATVTVGDPNFEGAQSINLTDSTGAQCTATVSGIVATCTMTDIATPTSYTISYPGGTTTTQNVSTAHNGVQAVTSEWPASVVQINNPQVTIQQATVLPCGGSASSASWNGGTGCSTPGVANPWPSSMTVAANSHVFLYATAYGSLQDDFNPLNGDGSVEGYLNWNIAGGTENTDYYDWNYMNGPDNTADCSRMDLQSWDSTTGLYGPDEPTGYCEFDFKTPGTYTVSVGYVSEDPNFVDQPSGPSISLTVVP